MQPLLCMPIRTFLHLVVAAVAVDGYTLTEISGKKKKEAYSKATARKLGMEGECEMLTLYTI